MYFVYIVYIKTIGIFRDLKKENGMKKYNQDAESIISLENSENYGRLHVSNFRTGSWSGYKKFYVYRVCLKNGSIVQSNPFISDLDAFRMEMERRCISPYFD